MWTDPSISQQKPLTTIPPDLNLEKDEVIISVGLKLSPPGLQFKTPVEVTVSHSAIFTNHRQGRNCAIHPKELVRSSYNHRSHIFHLKPFYFRSINFPLFVRLMFLNSLLEPFSRCDSAESPCLPRRTHHNYVRDLHTKLILPYYSWYHMTSLQC